MYIQLNWYHGKLFEVFATLGRGGGCAVCQSEALTRGITLGIKCGIPVPEYARQLKGIRCPNPMPFPKEDAVFSCPDAIARTLEKYGMLPIDKVVDILLQANGDSTSHSELSPEEEEQDAVAQTRELAREREEQGVYE